MPSTINNIHFNFDAQEIDQSILAEAATYCAPNSTLTMRLISPNLIKPLFETGRKQVLYQLSRKIREKGFDIRKPLISISKGNLLYLVDGTHRRSAAEIIGLENVPTIIIEYGQLSESACSSLEKLT